MHVQNSNSSVKQEVFAEAYRAYAGALYGIANRLAPNKAVAGQILTTAFVSWFEDSDAHQQRPSCFAQLTAAVFNGAASILKAHVSAQEVALRIHKERERLYSRLKHDL